MSPTDDAVVGLLRHAQLVREAMLHDAKHRGTQFIEALPLMGADDLEPRATPADRDLQGSEIVLVVDDEPVVRSVVRQILERYGYTVFDAPDGVEALNLTDMFQGPLDLILTDVDMPDLNGAELISALEAEGHLPKVLMMSGHMPEHLTRHSMSSDGHPFIKKPFTHQELATRVREVLDAT